MSEDHEPIKKVNPRWRRLLTAGVWAKIKERRSDSRISKTVIQRIASNPAVIGLVASATVVGAASGLGLVSTASDSRPLERRVVVLEQKAQDTEQIKTLLNELKTQVTIVINQTEINTADIKSLRESLETFKKALEGLSVRMTDLEAVVAQLINDLKNHEHFVPTTTTVTTVPATTTTTVPTVPTTVSSTTTTLPPVTTTTTSRKEDKKECLTRTTRGEERTCSPHWDWLRLRLGVLLGFFTT